MVVGAQVPPKVEAAIMKANADIAKIIAVPKAQRNFDNTIGAMDALDVWMDNETSMIIFMQHVSPDAKSRDEGRAAEEAVVNWGIEVGKREDLYKAIKEYADTKPKLEGEQKRLLDFIMRDYRRSGISLPKDKRDKLKELETEISKLGIEFERNIAEDGSKLPLSLLELKGVPDDVVKRLPKVGELVLAGFDGPTYGAIMDYCEVEATRQKMQWMYRRRGGAKNVAVLEKMLKARAEASKLLGYANTVDYEIEVRMAKNSKTVAKFYEDLLPIVRKKALQDFNEFQESKRTHLGDANATFNPWDYSFYKNRLKREKYAVDTQKVSEYFPMDAVVKGLFSITQSLYGIDMVDITAQAKQKGFPIWHEDVKLYELYDKQTKNLLGRMYTDLYPRENKYTHAACWGLQPRRKALAGKDQVPLAALVCNFTKPTADKPSLLEHDEVETFFHEFGHGLHHMLADSTYARFSGTRVARDFVEAPSQMMENWIWDPAVLRTFAKHYQTGDSLPDAMLEGMKSARTLGSGIETEGQFFLGKMDQIFHTAPNGSIDTTKAALAAYEECTLFKATPNTMPQAAFGHLNGYQGAYYGYLWSLVYAQDMFQRFEEQGLLNPEAGAYYRKKVLARGGSMDEMDMLRDYLGREPRMDAFLKHLGLKG
ncbi:MAG: Oligopeptidase A [Fimbriimonadaceae bacterium]|nr:Oligopeptidase A [Fimbriimonadaceae bacterium]